MPGRLGAMAPETIRVPSSDSSLTLDQLTALIDKLEADIRPTIDRIGKLKRRRSGIIGGTKSGLARVRLNPVALRMRHRELGSGRGTIQLLMIEFGVSERTIHRHLGYRHERKVE
jgi:hypothetical protein